MRNHFAAIGGTKLSEDCAQKGRALESTGGNANKTMRPQRLWDHLVSSMICSKVHGYQEVPWEGMPIPRGMQGSLGPNLYKASVRGTPAELKDIMGSSSTTSWYSPSALCQCEQDLDLELAFACEATGEWDLAGDVRWCALLKDGFSFLIRDSRWPGSQWFFSMGVLGGVAGLGWPAKVYKAGGVSYFALDPAATMESIKPLFLHSIDNWRALPFEWQSPLAIALAAKSGTPKGVGALAMPSGKPEALLTLCAKKAFGKLPKQALLFIAKETGAPWADGDTLFQRLEKIVKHLLPHLSHQAVLDIMAQRLKVTDYITEFFLTEDVSDMVTKDQEEDINKRKEGMATASASQEAFKVEFRKKLQAVRKAAVSQRGKKNEIARAGQVRGPTPPPAMSDDTTEAQVNASMPENFRVWRDAYNSRWQLIYNKKRVKSYSWQLYSLAGAASRSLQEAWRLHKEFGGLDPPWPFPESWGPMAPAPIDSNVSKGAAASSTD